MAYSAYNLPQPSVPGPAEENEGQFEDTEESHFHSGEEQAFHHAEKTGQRIPRHAREGVKPTPECS